MKTFKELEKDKQSYFVEYFFQLIVGELVEGIIQFDDVVLNKKLTNLIELAYLKNENPYLMVSKEFKDSLIDLAQISAEDASYELKDGEVNLLMV